MANGSNPGGVAAESRGVALRRARSGRPVKLAVWAAMGLMTLSVALLSELPLLAPGTTSRAHLFDIRWLLIPHVAGAALALTTGAVQFSSRIRLWNLGFHRITGRIYVGAIFVAGPAAIVMSHGTLFFEATLVQAGAWLVTAAAALLTARNRQIEQHRQWVVRSYAVTFTFIVLHVVNPTGFWTHFSEADYATAIIICTFLAVLVPDVAFSWRAMTRRRG
jgi:hypothetical protein